MHSISRTYYVYVLARPNGAPFYVGKGTGDRITRHELFARQGKRAHISNIIRKIWRDGGEVHRQIVFQTDDEQEAFAFEIALIAAIGRAYLANRSDGGEGPSGHTKSDECREQLSIIAKERFSKPDARDYLRRPHTPEARASMSAARTGRTLTPGHRANQAKAKRGVKFTEEHKRNLSISVKAAMNRPEVLEKKRQYRHSAEAKAKIAESNRRRAQKRRKTFVSDSEANTNTNTSSS